MDKQEQEIIQLNRVIQHQNNRIDFLEKKAGETEMMLRKLDANFRMIQRKMVVRRGR